MLDFRGNCNSVDRKSHVWSWIGNMLCINCSAVATTSIVYLLTGPVMIIFNSGVQIDDAAVQ